MLEVCFSDSAKGALLLAQHCGGDVIAASIGVITNARGLRAVWEKRKALREYKKRRAELKKLAVPLGGRREDVVSVSFGLSEGDIRSPITPGECPRKACVRDWLAFSRYGEKILETEVNAFWDGCLADLRKLQARPDRVRIWLDATPDAQCGLLFLADLYREGGTELHLVELPRQVRQPDGCLVEYRGWAEIEPERFGAFLSRERVLPPAEVRALAGRWQALRAENAPLRVVEQGRVVSAGLDYYDGLIRQAIPDAPCQAVQIIGTALGKQKVPTGDRFSSTSSTPASSPWYSRAMRAFTPWWSGGGERLPFFFRNRRIPLRSRPFCAMMQTRTCKEEPTMSNKTRKIAATGMLCALTYVVMAVGRVPVVLFLKYDPSDIVVTLGGLIWGPMTAFTVSATVAVIEMLTVSDTGLLGCIMNIVQTVSFACTAAAIYRKRRTLGGAVAGLLAGCAVMAAVMMLWNYFLTPLYMGYPREAVVELLLPAFLPFNLLKGGLNASLTFLLYKPVVTALRKSGFVPAADPARPGGKPTGLLLAAAFVAASCVLFILSWNGII